MTKATIRKIRINLKDLRNTRDQKERMFHLLRDDTSRQLFLKAQSDYQTELSKVYKMTNARSCRIVEGMLSA